MSLPFRSISLEEENRYLKLELQAKCSELQKLKAISEQQSFFLNQQLEEVKAREANIKSMNETIMQVLQDITSSNTKISTEIQLKQFLEDHIRSATQNNGNNEQEVNKCKMEIERLKAAHEQMLQDLDREKQCFLAKIQVLEEDKIKGQVEVQNAKLTNKGIFEKLKLEHEREIMRLRGEMEELQGRNGDWCSLELMKSQIKELTTQHLIEENSLKTALNESRAKLERVYEAFCELKEKNAQMKAIIQGFRTKEARLKDLLYDNRAQTEPDEDDFGFGPSGMMDISYSNNMGLKPRALTQRQDRKGLDLSSITNVLDALSSQELMKANPESLFMEKSPRTERIEVQKEEIRTTIEFVKKRSHSQQFELKPEEFSKPFELEKMEKERLRAEKEFNDSMNEFRCQKGKNTREYSEFMSMEKKSEGSLI